jgi:hypothetical protein
MCAPKTLLMIAVSLFLTATKANAQQTMFISEKPPSDSEYEL